MRGYPLAIHSASTSQLNINRGPYRMDEQKKELRPFAASWKWILENHPESFPSFIDFLQARSHKFREALFFAEQHIKAGKPWDEECEKVIAEALYPKPPKRFAKGPAIPRE